MSDDGSDIEYEPPDSEEDEDDNISVPIDTLVQSMSAGPDKFHSMPSSKPTLCRQHSYDQMDMEGVKYLLNRCVDEVAETLCIPYQEALAMLIAKNFQAERLKIAYFDDPDATRRDCGVTAGEDPAPLPEAAATEPDFFDLITLEAVPWSETDAPACGHRGAKSSWRKLLTLSLQNSGQCFTNKCLESGSGCRELLRERMYTEYLSPEQFARYNAALLRGFVNASHDLAACPYDNCAFVVRFPVGGARDVECGNGHCFCFKCTHEAHRPATCSEVDRWRGKMDAEAADAKWILANTKQCPKCKTAIDKNGGCNHMTCRKDSGGCGHEFCWICGGKWDTHGGSYYECNKPKDAAFDLSDAREAAKHELLLFSFYAERYENHNRSQRLADAMKPQMAERSEAYRDLGMPHSHADFWEMARKLVVTGHRVAKFTYVHAFYMPEKHEKAMFQDFQGMMEHHLDLLHELLEGPVLPPSIEAALRDGFGSIVGDLMAFREKVVKLTSVTEKYMNDVLNDMDNKVGLD